MATRVLATPEAAAAISQIENILNSGLTETISSLNTQGQILSEPNVWDGNLADDFRQNVWPACHSALRDAYRQLQDLQGKLKQIHANIMQAGGNAPN
jgi:uncharacterized protein YukE